MADPIINLEAAEARAREYLSRPAPPKNETAEARARRIMAEPEEEATTEEEPRETPADSGKGNDQSSIRVRGSFNASWSGTTIDTPQPSETARTVNLSTSGDGYSRIDPVTAIHVSLFPGKQPLLYRFGAYASYRRLRATREDSDYRQETDATFYGLGFTFTGGPAIAPHLEGLARTLLDWKDVSLGFIGGQISGGLAVARADLDVTRPNPLDAHETGGEWALAPYFEVEATVLYVNLGGELKPWAQLTLGLDNYFFTKFSDRPTGGFRDFWIGDRTADGDFKVRSYLQPTIGAQFFW